MTSCRADAQAEYGQYEANCDFIINTITRHLIMLRFNKILHNCGVETKNWVSKCWIFISLHDTMPRRDNGETSHTNSCQLHFLHDSCHQLSAQPWVSLPTIWWLGGWQEHGVWLGVIHAHTRYARCVFMSCGDFP